MTSEPPERRLLKVRVPARLALALEAHRLLSGDSKSATVEEALAAYLKNHPPAPGAITLPKNDAEAEA